MIRTRFPSLLAAASALALVSACGGTEDPEEGDRVATEQNAPDYGYETYSDDNLADTMASNDEAYLGSDRSEGTNGGSTSSSSSDTADSGDGNSSRQDTEIEDTEERPIMKLQVALDRTGFGPGVIDGKMGMSTENALRGFQEANDIEVTGENDEATREALARYDRLPATRVVTIPESWGGNTYYDIPESTEAKAEMERLGYKSLDEKLAERFHTTIEVLRRLNPGGRPAGAEGSSEDDASSDSGGSEDASGGSYFTAGQMVRVPNIGADRIAPAVVEDREWQRVLASLGVGTEQPEVDRIVVSKAGKTLKAYSGEDLVALFTVSSGSSEFPLPLGEWNIVGEAYMPPYSYDPEVLGLENAEQETYTLPPGPNGPVGVVWIDLSKEHYGIHGTPDPETIGRAQSSGCVRLTNWDAARLSQMVSQDTQVIFEA
ncbi:MAG: L,D-transpeptidase family protein [Erythrobacter sp.]